MQKAVLHFIALCDNMTNVNKAFKTAYNAVSAACIKKECDAMFYKKNNTEKLDDLLFKSPTSEYRGAPFWAWNCRLEKEELLRQIDIFKEMGLGGFHMHVRTGMATKYLSDEYIDFIKACTNKAKQDKMLAYLYDEDRWPSGSAGGYVTSESDEYRKKMLRLTTVPYVSSNKAAVQHGYGTENLRTEEGTYLTCFDVLLDENGCLKSYKVIEKDDNAEGTKWYAYVDLGEKSTWFNNQSYIDTLSKPAMDRFIDITYNAYLKSVGDEFGKTVPSIFTDEPQVSMKDRLEYSTDKKDVTIPWTTTLPETFKKAYGVDLVSHIPEIFWELPNGEVSQVRYQYHDHVAERFAEAFADNCGKWCGEHGIMLTGHMMEEQNLISQTRALGEVMRNYRGFQQPGIDILCAGRELTTAKQAQSAVHQYGREGMLSELYGVTGWDFDLRSHKLHGDWQAAYGVTVRVQHLSWVSMKGEAKRDYPASISYQSPWYKEYHNVEDHFARVNTALTRGKPLVKVGVIHPVESCWLHWGPNDLQGSTLDELNKNFLNCAKWFAEMLIDYDYISESLLPSLCKNGGAPLKVGKMEYDAIVVPGCDTLRSTTLQRLEEFKNAGGKLIFMGKAPRFCDAVRSDRGEKLFEKSTHIDFTKNSLCDALEDERLLKVRYSDGRAADRYCHQLRRDGDGVWLFLAQCTDPESRYVSKCYSLQIALRGEYDVTLYNTENGDITPLESRVQNGFTVFDYNLYDYGSLLIYYSPRTAADSDVCKKSETKAVAEKKQIATPYETEFTLSEPNVVLLDMAEFKLDDGDYEPTEEILRLDSKLRERLGMNLAGGFVAQPWTMPDEVPQHTVTLRFTIETEIEVNDAELALEDADKAEIKLNGKQIEKKTDGWYVDKSIEKVKLPTLEAGTHYIEVTLPFGERTNTEWCYLLGTFGVEVNGRKKTIKALPKTLCFGDIVPQGLPFYGGNVTYKLPVKAHKKPLTLHVPHYVGGIVTAEVNGKKQAIMTPPYNAVLEPCDKDCTVDLTLYGNRFNSFGQVHATDITFRWIGPQLWRTEGDEWSYEYLLRKTGIFSSPVLFEEK